MAEFFAAFGPLFAGFRQRAVEVQALLRDPGTVFVLVAGPGEERNPDTLFFARKLREAGYRLGPVIVNRVHPPPDGGPAATPGPAGIDPADGRALLAWLAARDGAGVAALRGLLPAGQALVDLPLLPSEPVDLPSLASLGETLQGRLSGDS
jgi:anion-transporting  ArsA/GET3 family ATPase